MTAIKSPATGGTTYSVSDAHGNQVLVKQGQPSFVGGAPTITLAGVTLTKQAVIDLLPALTAFASSGVLS
jgi:hypothetical protein